MIDKGRLADLVADFALPVPSTVIALMLGVPEADYDFFQTQSQATLDLSIPIEESQAAHATLSAYLSDLADRREREPGEDVISQLLADRVATGELKRKHLVDIAQSLLVAGHETTSTMIGLGTLTLLRHPDQLAVVRDSDDPQVVARAVEELLRYLTIAENAVTRVARKDITIGGQLVRAGEGLVFSIPAGNRDTALDSDINGFDIDRTARGHLAFGHGVHQCLGQNLAWVELQIALPTLLRRLPGLRLAVPFEEVSFRKANVVYGLERLPVTW
ncbi:cytochrome P450 [Lentzea sp. NPDC004782]|uniref:cytochrome P450 n=1 Tax=Lentzea sp. NPDC004782 TaxID=3154458 RepID=UPI0033B4B3B0